MVFRVLYVYDFVTKLCRQHAEVIPNLDSGNVRKKDEAKPDTGNTGALNVMAVESTSFQMSATTTKARSNKA